MNILLQNKFVIDLILFNQDHNSPESLQAGEDMN